ncbi:phosphatidate cytidylyltransferase [Mesorhizobium sp. CGMCC 1.15528]|uniref:Phosphatidate cytidylyltransferase n=1 Tax=Mesorhizobium zhangyense TaxID=1776730 RepID=A0A7C9R4S4_9HYPH|nr:phosphatidate cytidylyltransferase [Mesorhizobium zhangyense]NGN40014.1 phosphatidate cytidylyltransferase [Mesorhizobium zhangyense]
MSNLQLRVISGIVMAAAVLLLAWLGGLPFRILSAAIAAAVFYEWCAMSRTSANPAYQALSAILLAAALIVLVVGFPAAIVFAVLACAVVASALTGLIRGQGTWTTVGLAYAALSGVSLAFLRDADKSGLMAILFLFATVWATDIFAYFVGRAIGGPKLAPSISPGKTWSGAVGGTVCGMIAGLAVAFFAGGNLLTLVPVVFLLSVASQIGDLFESWVKRRHRVKDSSNLIPGHGGVMDRVDGLVVAAFALYVIGALLGGADHPASSLFPA